MTILLLLSIAVLLGRAGLSLRRLWSALPDRNLDFGLTPDDLDLTSGHERGDLRPIRRGLLRNARGALLGSALRLAHRWSPALATRLALQLFFTPLPGKQLARAQAVPEPWSPTHHPFEDGALITWQRPDLSSGRPRILLVHGWAGDAQQWRPLGERLAAAGFDPVLVDLPAHGRSDGARSTLPQWVRALFAVSARLGPWHGIAAHSLGPLHRRTRRRADCP